MGDEMIAVPRAALEFVLEHGDFCDRGPPDEGWQSEEMEEALMKLNKVLEK